MSSRAWMAAAVAIALAGGGLLAEEAHAGDHRGAEIYADLCAGCHGRYGRGDGPLADVLAGSPTDFTDSAWLADRTTEQVVEGLAGAAHTPMAIGRVLERDALRDAVVYARSLSGPGGGASRAEGRDIYNATCWVCHGRDGEGDGPAAANLETQPRDFTSPEFTIAGREGEIARTIAQGAEASFHGSTLMPEWGSSLSERQIQGLIAYLETLRER